MLSLWYAIIPFSNLRPKYCEEYGDLKELLLHLKNTQQSLMIKHFPMKKITSLACARTADGIDLYDVIDPALSEKEIEIGVQIPHVDCLCVFSALFDPIIGELHQNFKSTARHPDSYYGVPAWISNLDPSGNFILFTQFESVRNLEGYNFENWATTKELAEIEYFAKRGIKEVTTHIPGKYMQWHDIDGETLCFLKNNGLAFDELSEYIPEGKGFYINDEKNIVIWINHQHHVKIITIGSGGDLKVPYFNLELILSLMERRCQFSKHERLGNVGPNVETIGTGMTIRAFLNLPNLESKEEEIMEFVASYGFKLRKVFIPNVENIPDCNWKLENRTHLGITEFKTLSNLQFLLVYLIGEEMTLNTKSYFPKVMRPAEPTCEEMHPCNVMDQVEVCPMPCPVEKEESVIESVIEETESSDTSFTEDEPKLETKSCVQVSGDKFTACFSSAASTASATSAAS